MKMVRIFSNRIQDRIRVEGFRSVRIRVRIFNIRYRIRIWILKSYIYDVDIQSYLIRHDWHYPYLNQNPTKNMKTNMISVISVRIRSVFIPIRNHEGAVVQTGAGSLGRISSPLHAETLAKCWKGYSTWNEPCYLRDGCSHYWWCSQNNNLG